MDRDKEGEKDNQLSKSLLAQSQDLFSSENEDTSGMKETPSVIPSTSTDPTMKALMDLTAKFDEFKKKANMSMASLDLQGRI